MSTPKPKRRSSTILVVGLIIVVVLLAFKGPLQRRLMLNVALKESSVSAELVEEIAAGADGSIWVYEAFWNTGKIPHRLAALRALSRGGSLDNSMTIPSWLHNAAMDGDLHVRELAMGVLAEAGDPALERMVHTWIMEPDPELKQLALRQARTSGMTNLIHTVAPLLNHPDIRVRIAAATNLRIWSGEDYGVRMVKLNGNYNEHEGTYSGEDLVKYQQIVDGLEKWNQWWANVGEEQFPTQSIEKSPGETEVVAAPDFTLHSLDHKDISLSNLSGKPVLLNFWATWCSACWSEIPDLIELNDRLGDRVHIIGISLDGLPDQHEIDHGHSHGDGSEHTHGLGHEELEELVGNFVAKNKMDYQILLDPEGITSELYAGNELPMNVMIDANGNLHRRFMGSRSLAGFEAMLNEILPE